MNKHTKIFLSFIDLCTNIYISIYIATHGFLFVQYTSTASVVLLKTGKKSHNGLIIKGKIGNYILITVHSISKKLGVVELKKCPFNLRIAPFRRTRSILIIF